MNILLIEDNPANADIYKTILQTRLGADVTHVLTGIDGVWAARKIPFDAILIDFDLPDIHGTQVGLALYHLIQKGIIEPTAMIALTAQSDKATVDEAERLGFDAFLCKPCLESDFVQTLRQMISSSERETQ